MIGGVEELKFRVPCWLSSDSEDEEGKFGVCDVSVERVGKDDMIVLTVDDKKSLWMNLGQFRAALREWEADK
jgi:hypothetical protein